MDPHICTFAAIAAIIWLVIFHEAGHWLVARMLGFKTPVFSVGLPGPHIKLFKFWDTEFRFSFLLLGGYVEIPELGADEPDAESGVLIPVWKRALVAAAGPAANFIIAFAIMFAVYSSIGIPTTTAAVVQLDNRIHIARDAGIQPGDRILAIDDKEIATCDEIPGIMASHRNVSVRITLDRGGKHLPVTLTPNSDGRTGIALNDEPTGKYTQCSLADSFGRSCEFIRTTTVNVCKGYAVLVHLQPAPAGMPKGAEHHGIVTAVQVTAQVLGHRVTDFYWIVAALSVNLAIFNLFPVPALDGGHLMFLAIESVRRKPVPAVVRNVLGNLCFLLLLLFGTCIIANDVINPLKITLR